MTQDQNGNSAPGSKVVQRSVTIAVAVGVVTSQIIGPELFPGSAIKRLLLAVVSGGVMGGLGTFIGHWIEKRKKARHDA